MLSSEEEPEKAKLGARHSLPPKTNTTPANNSRVLKRVTSVPIEATPPPPPPPPPLKSLSNILNMDDEPRGAEIVEVVEEPTLRPSDIVKGMCRSMSSLSKYYFFNLSVTTEKAVFLRQNFVTGFIINILIVQLSVVI